MFTLVKYSSPGWEKEFADRDALVEELRDHICGSCLLGSFWHAGEGGELVEVDTYDRPIDVYYQDKLYECRDIGMLLSTPCGCEYGVKGIDWEME